MTDPRYCSNCVHCGTLRGAGGTWCRYPDRQTYPHLGVEDTKRLAVYARRDRTDCGPEGRWYKPYRSLWTRIREWLS